MTRQTYISIFYFNSKNFLLPTLFFFRNGVTRTEMPVMYESSTYSS